MSVSSTPARTLFQKVWHQHVVTTPPDGPSVLYIDLHLVHEVTSPQAFTLLRQRRLGVHRPDKTMATADHSIPTIDQALPIADAQAARQVAQLEENCREFGVPLHGVRSPRQGIVHVISPELGLSQPGMTIVCGDSHTATHGAFGALAFGIGTSEVAHVLATQCLLQYEPRTFEVRLEGRLQPGVTAKDVILALIATIGISGGTGHVFEYTGPAIRALSMEGRMTICNMSIEGGARAWDAALEGWRRLSTDPDATCDRSVTLDVDQLEPMITYGTNPGMGMPITGRIPGPNTLTDPSQRKAVDEALRYMDLRPERPLQGHPIDVVFIGSCTNGRISDLRRAASLLDGRQVRPGIRALAVPGSQEVKRQAEAEGLDRVFREAGFEWREPGCSMCIAMNGDELQPGEYCVSTSNRNFQGRQGKGGRTFLASPLTAAASALTGVITDPRTLMNE